jgi:hypothetical protein
MGKTEKEALLSASQELLRCLQLCHKKMKVIGDCLMDKGFWLSGDFCIDSYRVQKEGDFKTHKHDSFTALMYDEELKMWCRYYR